MPHSELHKKKKIKNYALLAIIICAMITFFAITIVRISSAA